MCGIAGLLLPAGEQGETAERMVAALRHRGPDDRGLSRIEHGAHVLWLGNTRLAILDPGPGGHQPMTDPETGNQLVFNGEIYNHRELRRRLDREWRSGSDTETLLAAYAAWGESCLAELRGMFAFALWDQAAGRLWCARDRLGIKPFYYHHDGQRLIFASEVRALLASGRIERTLDRAGLGGYLRYGSVPEPFTPFAGVRSLPAGHTLTLAPGGAPELRCWWRPAPVAAGGSLREALAQAVSEHLLADVPVACFLSGGLDSSVVTALAARAAGAPLQTFTLGFADSALDESAHAAAVAAHCGTVHRCERLTGATALELVPHAVEAMDLPTADGINSYLVSRVVAQAGWKVVLSGLGGDELFGGYPSFWDIDRARRLAPLLGLLPAGLRAWLAGGGERGRRAAEMTARGATPAERYCAIRAYWHAAAVERMGLPAGAPLADCPADDPSPTRQASRFELSGYMRSVLLRDSDVMSMAHGLELRVPLLDHRLVEGCLALDAARGCRKARPKPLLVETARDLLPPGIAERSKQGFFLPMGEWVAGPLSPFADAGLDLLHARELVRFDPADLRRRQRAGDLGWAQLWQLAVLGHWLERHGPE